MTISSAHNLSREQWAERLNEQWDHIRETTVLGFKKLGDDLIEAKTQLVQELGNGFWIEFINTDLTFGRKTAHALMKSAKWMSNNVGHLDLLPPDWGTIYKLSCLDDENFERLVGDGTIRPSLQRNEVSAILRRERVEEDEARILTLVPIIGKFRTLVIDPAWEYDWLSLAGRAKPGYAMETIEQLRNRDVAAWADEEVGCHLYCWVTNNFMAEACKLVAHWGFQHRTILTWIKPPPFGLGSYFRNSTEHVIFATRGKTTTRPAAASIPTHFEAPRGEHSEKPEKFYEIVRAASYPPYGEANQREPRPDFTNLFEVRDAPSEAAAE
jgi:N6-adenosine-specific RNA methylase IME4